MKSEVIRAISPTGIKIRGIWRAQHRGESLQPIRTHRHAEEVTITAIYDAIRNGERFTIGDIKQICCILWRSNGEGYYRAAIEAKNRSFMSSMDAFLNRRPIFYKYARLFEGKEILWKGESVRVTSINYKKGFIVTCTYHPGTQKVLNRYKITREELREQSRAPG